jgi:protoporphyrinogen/coproporphyrinogen III oxidase
VVLLVYPPGTAERLAPGSGFIVPPTATDSGGPGPSAITASTWVSSKWPREEHAGRAVIRCYLGRFGDDEAALERPDRDLAAAAARDIESASPLGSEPEATKVVRWPRSMPQYEVGHLDRLARIDGALAPLPGLFLVGSAYRGVGVADCVRQAGESAERVRAFLAAPEGTPTTGGSGAVGGGADIEQEAIT